jgi:hypothetical protein
VIGSSIKSIPVAGRDLSIFVQQLMRERGERVPPEDSLDVARRVKEAYCYTCADIVKVHSIPLLLHLSTLLIHQLFIPEFFMENYFKLSFVCCYN